MSEEAKVIELPEPTDITFDETVRRVVEAMFDYDNDTSYLTACINKGKTNETEVELMFKIVRINEVDLGNNEEEVA